MHEALGSVLSIAGGEDGGKQRGVKPSEQLGTGLRTALSSSPSTGVGWGSGGRRIAKVQGHPLYVLNLRPAWTTVQ